MKLWATLREPVPADRIVLMPVRMPLAEGSLILSEAALLTVRLPPEVKLPELARLDVYIDRFPVEVSAVPAITLTTPDSAWISAAPDRLKLPEIVIAVPVLSAFGVAEKLTTPPVAENVPEPCVV